MPKATLPSSGCNHIAVPHSSGSQLPSRAPDFPHVLVVTNKSYPYQEALYSIHACYVLSLYVRCCMFSLSLKCYRRFVSHTHVSLVSFNLVFPSYLIKHEAKFYVIVFLTFTHSFSLSRSPLSLIPNHSGMKFTHISVAIPPLYRSHHSRINEITYSVLEALLLNTSHSCPKTHCDRVD